ncbi:MAG: sensor histidine kinase [Limnohabitans sp.]|nr:sensor histidine kinase [Limnohabitans sp.]
MRNKFKIHIIFWVVYFLYATYAEFAYLDTYLSAHIHIDWVGVLGYAIVSVLVFLISIVPCYYILLAILDGKFKKISTLFFKIIASVIVVAIFVITFRLLCHYLVYSRLYEVEEDIDAFNLFGIFNALMNIGYPTSLALGFEKFRQQLVIKDEMNELKTEKLKSEMKFLKAQINPHFLFNTLNNIYGLSLKKSDDAPEIIMKLSKIMRYSIFESAKEFVSIEDEIENIKDYIEIQRIRYKDLVVQFESNIDDFSKEISPLILLQFIENAFKYGTSETTEKPLIVIKVLLIKGIFHFEVTNSKGELPQTNSTKIGLKNLERQLDLLYKDRYELIVDNLDTIFTVKLTIFLNNE